MSLQYCNQMLVILNGRSIISHHVHRLVAFSFQFCVSRNWFEIKVWDGSKIFHMTAEVGWRNIYFLANGSVHRILSQKTLLFSASNAIKIPIPLMGLRILDAQRLTFFQDRNQGNHAPILDHYICEAFSKKIVKKTFCFNFFTSTFKVLSKFFFKVL